MTETATHIVRVSLKAKLYRDIEIGSGRSLYDLGEAIVRAFGFNFDHAFGFYSTLTGGYTDAAERYELFADLDEGSSDAGSVKRTRIARAFPVVGKTMLFIFDYGDEWRFKVKVIGLGQRQPKVRYPRVIASVGTAPPQYPDMEGDGA